MNKINKNLIHVGYNVTFIDSQFKLFCDSLPEFYVGKLHESARNRNGIICKHYKIDKQVMTDWFVEHNLRAKRHSKGIVTGYSCETDDDNKVIILAEININACTEYVILLNETGRSSYDIKTEYTDGNKTASSINFPDGWVRCRPYQQEYSRPC